MYEFFTAPGNLLFSIAFTLLILIAILELLSTMFGAAISGVIENALPDFDFGLDPSGEVDLNGPEMHGMTKFFVWLEIGRVPMLITLSFFLLVFSLGGFSLQSIAETTLLGHHLPWFLASPAVFVVVLPLVKFGNRTLAKIWPKDETAAISRQTFIGRTATILIGTATSDKPAEAKLEGADGKPHYVMVVADNEGESFASGTEVLLVSEKGSNFSVIEADLPGLD